MGTKAIKADKVHEYLRKFEQRTNVSAYIVMRGAEQVGTVRFHYPRDGAGKLTAFAADWTKDMPEGVDFKEWTRWQYGWATGYGYDKRTAAVGGMTIAGVTLKDQGWDWAHQLREAGLTVIQAI